MDQNNVIECSGFYFIHNFDSGNLGHVERVPTDLIGPSPLNVKTNSVEIPDCEFNMWTRPDCAGTEFENGNRTWFYFGVQAPVPSILVRFNLINLNKQGKMYNQGMAPVTRTLPGKPHWERICDRPVHSLDDNTFTLSFKFRTPENLKATTFFAFTYPYSFAELQIALNSMDLKMLPLPPPQSPDDIYYCRECLVYSLEGRRVDLLTITSHHGITTAREERLKNLFPEPLDRPFKFENKKVIFVSARVHPGETPSSFVFNGFLNLLLNRNDPVAIQLRKIYVFKLIPFLNPDGVARGHYRTDTRGVNLNRVYLNPSLTYHPTIYAARSLIRYYHYGCEKEDSLEDVKLSTSRSMVDISESSETLDASTVASKKKKAASKVDTFRRDKKSAVIKLPSLKTDKKPLTGETANLIDQVCDMKLHENCMSVQTSEMTKPKPKSPTNSSLLQESVLRSCLGSNVHLSTSGELNIPGSNPLRPLRDTLKNSISLLMESNPSPDSEDLISKKDSYVSNLKMGWCQECQINAGYLDASAVKTPLIEMPIEMLTAKAADNRTTCSTIDEYREQQRQQMDEFEKRFQEDGECVRPVFFCTNCFKRYTFNNASMEAIIDGVPSSESPIAVCVESVAAAPAPEPVPAPALPVIQSPPKEEKPRLAGTKAPPCPPPVKKIPPIKPKYKEPESGLHMYIDMHGHASKKGIFMYGNHFEDIESSVECMLLPRIMSLNSLHFHFSSCNFTERNMYLKDRRDGMSREGSGRVAVLKATGLVRSYTLECNYNTGRLVNMLPPTVREVATGNRIFEPSPSPPKYTPVIYEEVGRSLGSSILDLAGQHPNSRMPASEHRTLNAMRDWLRSHSRTLRPLALSRGRLMPTSPITRQPLFARSKVTEERKENAFVAVKAEERKGSPPALTARPAQDLVQLNMRFAKRNEPVKPVPRPLYLSENEPKPKSLTTKRRNVFAIRKPNSSKPHLAGVVKPKISRRSVDDDTRNSIAVKISKRSFRRSASRGSHHCNAMASSSSDELLVWQDGGGKRRFLQPSRTGKKIKMKK